jgi:hypothetical protein
MWGFFLVFLGVVSSVVVFSVSSSELLSLVSFVEFVALEKTGLSSITTISSILASALLS